MQIANQTASTVPFVGDEERTVVPIYDRAGADGSTLLAANKRSGNSLGVGTRLGEFEITRLIGIGGFGIVYLAFDHSLRRNVAIKEYMPAALASRTEAGAVAVKSDRQAETFQLGLKSFVNEAHLLAQYDHPSLLKVYRFWEANGTAYMVMPYYEGTTLKQTITNLRGRPPNERWLKDMLRPLTDALALIHRGSCFHRDIAPDNILILKGGRPLLLDFGAARRVIGDMTHALTVILKPGYAPIEQYAETPNMKQGEWTDIYALAAVVYFAISGQAPVPSVARIMSDPLVPLAKVGAGRYSAAFLRGVDKAMSVRPENRPQSIAELCDLLDLNEGKQQTQSTSPSNPSVAKSSTSTVDRNRSIVRYATGAVTLVALLGATTYLVLREQKPQTVDVVPTALPEAKTGQSDQTKDAEPLPAAQVAAPKADVTAPLEESAGRLDQIKDAAPLPTAQMAATKTAETAPLEVKTEQSNQAIATVSSPTAQTAVRRNASERAAAPALPRATTSSARCIDILQRASLGESLSPEEQGTLKAECN